MSATQIRWTETVKKLVEKHEAGELEVMTGPRYLTLSEQSALLTFAAYVLAVESNQDTSPK